MPITSYPNGLPSGVTIRGMSVNMLFPGNVLWLNNAAVPGLSAVGGSDNNAGDYAHPFNSLAGALASANVVANRGDIICVMPGHAETISSATALALNKAGVLILGLGQGDLRPTFTLDTANTANIKLSADNMAISNCVFKANFAAIASLFTVTTGSTAKNFVLSNCEFRDNSAILNFAKIVTTNVTSNAADGLCIEDCNFFGLGATSNTALVSMLGTNDRVTIRNNYIAHKATTAAGIMPIATGKVVTNLRMVGNICNLVGAAGLTTGLLITTDGSTNSGILANNYVQNLDATSPILETASSGLMFMENYYQSAADKSGAILPAIS